MPVSPLRQEEIAFSSSLPVDECERRFDTSVKFWRVIEDPRAQILGRRRDSLLEARVERFLRDPTLVPRFYGELRQRNGGTLITGKIRLHWLGYVLVVLAAVGLVSSFAVAAASGVLGLNLPTETRTSLWRFTAIGFVLVRCGLPHMRFSGAGIVLL